MADKRSVTLTLGFTNTDFTRKYKITDVDASALSTISTKVNAINASLAGGTDGGLADVFRADDYDASNAQNPIGKFNRIVAAQSDVVSETAINLN